MIATEAQTNQQVEAVYTFSALDTVTSVLGEDLQVRAVEYWLTSGDPTRVVVED